MSTLKVNAIEPYSGSTVTITGASIASASYAETANSLTAGTKTVNGDLNVNGNSILTNTAPGPNPLLTAADGNGTKLIVSNDDGVPVFGANMVVNGTSQLNGNTVTNGVASQTFTAPSQDYLDNKEVVRVNNATISGTSYNNVWFGMGQAAAYGNEFEDYFSIEYYDSFSYNFGSEFSVNGIQAGFQTIASGSQQTSKINTRDNSDGTSQVNLVSPNIVVSGLGDYADDATAASNGVKLNGLYRTGNVVKIRIV